MVAATKTAAKKTAEVPSEAPTEEGIKFSDLSPELRAIFEEAEKIKAEADAERQKKQAKITAWILAQFKIMRETGRNADETMAKIEVVSQLESEGIREKKISEVAEAFFQVVEALCGKHMAADFLKTVEGDKIAFVSIMKDVIRLGNVVKA